MSEDPPFAACRSPVRILRGVGAHDKTVAFGAVKPLHGAANFFATVVTVPRIAGAFDHDQGPVKKSTNTGRNRAPS